jgi:hypothetical protein
MKILPIEIIVMIIINKIKPIVSWPGPHISKTIALDAGINKLTPTFNRRKFIIPITIFTGLEFITWADKTPKIEKEIIIRIVEKIIKGLLLPILKVELSFQIPKKGSRNPKYIINP